MNVMDYLNSATKSLFRLEVLQTYDVTEEEDSFARFLATGKSDIVEEDRAWFTFLEDKHRAGIITERVRLVIEPLTDYTKYELLFHCEAVRHGDDIRIVDKATFAESKVPAQDYWLIDRNIVLLQNYDRDGKWLGFDVVTNALDYCARRDKLWKRAIPLVEFDNNVR